MNDNEIVKFMMDKKIKPPMKRFCSVCGAEAPFKFVSNKMVYYDSETGKPVYEIHAKALCSRSFWHRMFHAQSLYLIKTIGQDITAWFTKGV